MNGQPPYLLGFAFVGVFAGWPSLSVGQEIPAVQAQECVQVAVRNDHFLDMNIRPHINGIAVGEKLYVQGLSQATFTLKASTYLNAQFRFAIDPVGSSDVYFVPDLATLHVPDTSVEVRITVASRLWLSTVSLTDIDDGDSACPHPRDWRRR